MFQHLVFSPCSSSLSYGCEKFVQNCPIHELKYYLLVISQALQSSLQEQQKGLNYLNTTVEDLSRKAPAEVSQKYRSEIEVIIGRWKKLSSQLGEHCQKLEELMTKLQRFQVNQPFSASAIVVAFGHRKCIECVYTPQENNNKIKYQRST